MQMSPSSNVSPTSGGILPEPNLLLVNDVKEGRPSGPRVVLGRAGEVVDAADDACVDTLLAVLVVLVAELPGTRKDYQKLGETGKVNRVLRTSLSGVPGSPGTVWG